MDSNDFKFQLLNRSWQCFITYVVNVDEKVLIKKEDIIGATNIAQQFTYQEIAIATDNFSMILGQGGFGSVYKGSLTNGLDVAVKILSHASQQGTQEFLNEVFDLLLILVLFIMFYQTTWLMILACNAFRGMVLCT